MITFPGVSPFWMWTGFIALVIIMLEIDLGIFNRKDHVIGIRESLIWTCIWISVSMVFNGVLWYFFGNDIALKFFTGYVIEKSLSVDNLFVFLMIFTAFNIDRKYQHRVLYWGILGAIVMRGVFIKIGSDLVQQFNWMFLVFGAVLLWGAYKMEFQKEKKFDPDKNIAVRITKKIFPVTKKRHGHDFFIKVNGRWSATILFVALMSIELSDVVFATDSIPAIFAITTDPFLVFTSNIFAILGLRALYFAIAGLHSMFAYLKTGLAIILVFIGCKMIAMVLFDVHLDVKLSLIFILLVLIGSMVCSVALSEGGRHSKHLVHHEEGRVRVRVRKKDVKRLREQYKKT